MKSNVAKIGIATVYTGYNYGSALQAFATKSVLESLGYNSELLCIAGSLIKGRDIRIKKLSVIFARTVWRPWSLKRTLVIYKGTPASQLTEASKSLFQTFYDKTLQPEKTSYGNLRKRARTDEFPAFVCGSDQIWNSTTYYVDPFYYLRFAPINKRIAFAPSFGRDYVPDYNLKKITKYISGIPYRSVRESSGSDIVETIIGEKPAVLIDPTLILSANQWIEALRLKDATCKEKEPYILAYFLDDPSNHAIDCIEWLKRATGFKVIGIPYGFENSNSYNEVAVAGPREFVQLARNAAAICTDSFHGTAFALNFKIPFYTFDRNYGTAEIQSTRVFSLLELVSLTERFNPPLETLEAMIALGNSEEVLVTERKKAVAYLKNALYEITERK